jgi:hypothetical protein
MDIVAWRAAYESFLAQPGRWDWAAQWARKSGCLPVHADFTHAYGIDQHGAVSAFDFEQIGNGPPTGPIADPRIVNIVLYEGLKRYAWMADLVPLRPSNAQDCSMCEAGKAPLRAPSICYCGGAGWVPASDTWVNKDRFK